MDLIAVVLQRERGAPLEALSLHACGRPRSAHSGRPCASRDACSAVVPKHTRNEMWSGCRASNPGPRPWRGRALPAELHPLGANARRTQLCRRVRGNLLKSSPMRQCASVRPSGTPRPVADRLKNNEARILSESGPRRVIEWKGARLCASFARMHPILVTKRPYRSLALDRMPFIHREDRLGSAKGAHERTLTRQGQRAVCNVALALHDELFSDEVADQSNAAVSAARRRTVKSLHFIVKRVRQSFLHAPFRQHHSSCRTTSPSIAARTS
jgi:hypothetical protein